MQYMVLRKDLWAEMKWPLGSLVAQACHASTAVMWQSQGDQTTQEYLAPENVDHMHKVRGRPRQDCERVIILHLDELHAVTDGVRSEVQASRAM